MSLLKRALALVGVLRTDHVGDTAHGSNENRISDRLRRYAA